MPRFWSLYCTPLRFHTIFIKAIVPRNIATSTTTPHQFATQHTTHNWPQQQAPLRPSIIADSSFHSGFFLLVGVAFVNGITMIVTNAVSNWLCSVDWEWLSWVIVVLFVILPLLGSRNQYQGQLFPPCNSCPPNTITRPQSPSQRRRAGTSHTRGGMSASRPHAQRRRHSGHEDSFDAFCISACGETSHLTRKKSV
jgi:hypothetical protein